MITPSQRLTAAKSRKSKEGRDDEDGEGNTYCELALLPKRSEFTHSKPKCPITRVQKKLLQKRQLAVTMAWKIS